MYDFERTIALIFPTWRLDITNIFVCIFICNYISANISNILMHF